MPIAVGEMPIAVGEMPIDRPEALVMIRAHGI
jgi:hypothetical protein